MSKHPDEQIQERYRQQMNVLASTIDEFFNGRYKGHNRKTCFVLLIAPFNEEGRTNYISNGERADVVTMMKEMIARFEGQPEQKGGHA